MINEIIVPSPGESITRVQLAKWLVKEGEYVEKDQEVVEIDSDKASFPLSATSGGIIHILIPEGEDIDVGTAIARIDPSGDMKKQETLPGAAPSTGEKPKPAPVPEKHASITPLAEKIIREEKLPVEEIHSIAGNRKVTKKDIESFLVSRAVSVEPGTREEERKKLSTLRLKLAERLVSVRNETAMLTTFNEIDMTAVIRIREKYQEPFREKYGVGLGYMSFFTKAVTMALRDYPQVNSMIDGDEMVIPKYADIGIAVSAPKGLVVPVIRNAESMDLAAIEKKIKELAGRARENRLTLDEMKGGTFTITNGGVFGSLLSTPIINPPQSAILGMHKIVDRPVAVEGRVEIHPMMYVALSYDHRVVDGKDSVGFLVRVKEYLEDPIKMLTAGEDPALLLLGL